VDTRLRTYVLVALAAAGTAALVVGLVVLTRTSPRAAAETSTTTPGRAPPLVLDLGLRTDPEAVALRRANRLYSAGSRRAAGRIFARYKSVDARIGAAVSAWPDGTLARLDELATRHPSSGVVLLHLGLAQVASRKASAAEAAWRKVLERDPDSEAAVQAESLLHPRFAPGRPPFVPSSGLPAEVVGLSPARQLAALDRAARGNDAKAKLLYGSVLQRLGRPVSAERQFAAAARLAPGDAEVQTAAAVGLFSKAKPELAFSRLGPLAPRFPRSQTVRFHLGELLLWIGQLDKARQELRLARREGPSTQLGRTAAEFLAKLPR
jgi:tetratricopeptide (TPR) repeat protein